MTGMTIYLVQGSWSTGITVTSIFSDLFVIDAWFLFAGLISVLVDSLDFAVMVVLEVF